MSRLFSLLLLILPFGYTAPVTDPVDSTAELIRTGNMHELAKTFAQNIDLTILAENNLATPAQAEAALNTFFKANPVKSVSVLHRVDSNPSIRFGVLTVVTSTGSYRVSISFKLAGGQFFMNGMSIETAKN